jgi:hypothetical protein
MIDPNSKSYPYLAIAQRYGVPYAEVLKYSDDIKEISYKIDTIMIASYWKQAVWNVELNRNGRQWS